MSMRSADLLPRKCINRLWTGLRNSILTVIYLMPWTEDRPKSYWTPRVMRHTKPDGTFEYAVHEVYFGDYGYTWGETVHALSDRFDSVRELRVALNAFLDSGLHTLYCGDGPYTTPREHIVTWVDHVNDPVMEYVDD